MGEANQRRELSGVGVEAHRSVAELMELAWRLHRKNGHPEGYVGPCWGPTLDELQTVRDKLMQERMAGKVRPQPTKLHSERGCKCPKHRSTRHVLAACCEEFAREHADDVGGDNPVPESTGAGPDRGRDAKPVVRKAQRPNRRVVRNASRRVAK